MSYYLHETKYYENFTPLHLFAVVTPFKTPELHYFFPLITDNCKFERSLMPPKKKAASICDLCCHPIVDSKEDCTQCEGQCRLTFHHYCAGVSATHYKQFISTNRPFVCIVCNQQLQNERVSQLAAELESLKAKLNRHKRTASKREATL